MKITCQSCQSKYTVSDEKVQGKTVKIKCRKCGATILVNSNGVTHGPADAASVATADAGDAGGSSFLVNVGEGDQRSMSLQEIVAAYNSSVVTADTYVWADGMGDWQPLAQVESIVAALNNPGGAAAEAAPVAAPAPEPMAAAPADPLPRAAARRDVGRGGGRDLFGGGMSGGAAEGMATSGGGFGARPAPAPAPSGGRGGEENSMLFSLSALTAKTAPAPSSITTAASREDSGLIDLRALAASASTNNAASNNASASSLIPDHAGLFPLGAPPVAAPVAAAPMVMPSMPAPAANKTPLFIGIGIAIAAVAIVGTFLVMKSGGDKPVAAAPIDSAGQTAALSVAPPPPPPETASAVASADTAPTGSAAAVAINKGAPTAPAKGAPTAPAKGAATTPAKTPDKPAATTPPAGPKKGNCGCAAGDLMCAMKCSAH